MRITRDSLLRIARETIQERAHSDPELVAAYLTGSLLTPNPFLGGAADIDLVLVHSGVPAVRREIVPLTPEVHLDIVHAARRDYDNPKGLRTHPTLGPELYNPLWLYESQHFLEYVQAAVRTKFHDPANVLERARRNSHEARQLWLGLRADPPAGPDGLLRYLEAVSHAANAVAALDDGPLPERRFLLQFPARAEAAGRPDLAADLEGLLGAPGLDPSTTGGFLADWEKDFLEAAGSPKVDAGIAAPRLAYYKRSFESMLAGGVPRALLWPLLRTWTLAAQVLPQVRLVKWQAFCEALGLRGEALPGRLEALDRFLDALEELLEEMAARLGEPEG